MWDAFYTEQYEKGGMHFLRCSTQSFYGAEGKEVECVFFTMQYLFFLYSAVLKKGGKHFFHGAKCCVFSFTE